MHFFETLDQSLVVFDAKPEIVNQPLRLINGINSRNEVNEIVNLVLLIIKQGGIVVNDDSKHNCGMDEYIG